jgi:hypothetical protein
MVWRDEQLEFNIEEELKNCDFDKAESVKALKDRISEHVTFCRSEMKKSFKSRDEAKQALRAMTGKFEELSKGKPEHIARQKQLEARLLESAKKHKAINPVFLHRILKDSFKWDEEKEAFLSEGKDIETTVSDFLDDEQNDFLKESPIKSGSGHKFTPLYYRAPKPKPSNEDIEDADRLGLSLEDYLSVKAVRQQKLSKIKKAR